MLGLMQQQPLLISSLLKHAARHHGAAEVVSATETGTVHHTTWAETERRARQLVRALQALGVREADRVGTLAWNDYRHLEVYYATSGMQTICHTINPRLSPDDIAYIINHAGDSVLFIDPGFATLIGGIAPKIAQYVRAIVIMTDLSGMPALDLPHGMRLLCYDQLMVEADDDYPGPASMKTPRARSVIRLGPPAGQRVCSTVTARRSSTLTRSPSPMCSTCVRPAEFCP